MEQVDYETYQDIKNLIISYQNNLDGCVFLGDIVPAMYKAVDVILEGTPISTWPCDLYYMDLSGGLWQDADHDNILDNYSGDMKPEIFIGRISIIMLSKIYWSLIS